MARRKNDGGVFGDLFQIAAALPWLVGVGLAVVTYFFLHHYAVQETPTKPVPGQVGQMVVGQMIKSLAFYLQYVVPAIFCGGALASYIGRRKRSRLANEYSEDGEQALAGMNWQEFELLVGEAFRMKGYTVRETGGGGADGGVDLELKKGSETFLVQCKKWRAFKVSVETVRELYGVMAAHGAAGGFVVTSGKFTKDAQDFAEGRNIELVDGPALHKLVTEAKARRDAEPLRKQEPVLHEPAITKRPQVVESSPTCPRCGGGMEKRLAKQGAHAGKEFWGCQRFPECRGVRGLTEAVEPTL